MKKIIVASFLILQVVFAMAQLHSGEVQPPPSAQPVPNAVTTDRSAVTQPANISPVEKPVPPIYPGGDVKAVEIPRQLVNPPSTVSGTQPAQNEPLTPIESTNTLQPNRPPRDAASRNNPVTENPAIIKRNNTAPTLNTFKKSTATGKSLNTTRVTRPVNTNKLDTAQQNTIKKKVSKKYN